MHRTSAECTSVFVSKKHQGVTETTRDFISKFLGLLVRRAAVDAVVAVEVKSCNKHYRPSLSGGPPEAERTTP